MGSEKVYAYLGFAARARKLASGYNTCLYMLQKKRIEALLLAADLSENSKEKLIREAGRQKVPWRTFGCIRDLSHRTGTVEKGVYGVLDPQFAKIILQEIDHMQPDSQEVF